MINTGLQSNGVVVEQNWAASFIEGLVPPSEVSTISKCPNGVAKVETQHSFLNMLAAGITWGIYTPMTITVTCATGSRSSLDSQGTVVDLKGKTAKDAAHVRQELLEAETTGRPVYLLY